MYPHLIVILVEHISQILRIYQVMDGVMCNASGVTTQIMVAMVRLIYKAHIVHHCMWMVKLTFDLYGIAMAEPW